MNLRQASKDVEVPSNIRKFTKSEAMSLLPSSSDNPPSARTVANSYGKKRNQISAFLLPLLY